MIRVELHDRSNNLVKVLSRVKNAAFHAVLNQDGTGTFLIHRADPDVTTYNFAFGGVDGYICHLLRKGPYETVYTDRFSFVIEAVVPVIGQQEEAGAWFRVSGRGTLCFLEDRMSFPPNYDGSNQSSITGQFQNYVGVPGGAIMAGEIDRSNARFAVPLTHSKDVAGSGYSAAVLADGPVGYWRLGESAGPTIADSSGGAHSGAAVGGITYSVPGALVADANTAVTLNGTTGYFTITTAPALHPGDTFSLEAWVKSLAVTQQAIVTIGTTNEATMVLTSTGRVMVFSNGIIATTANPVNDNLWHHLVWTKSGATNHIYVDGTDVTPAVTNRTVGAGATPILIGIVDAVNQFFNGSLDEVAIYPTALSTARVQAHYLAAGGYASQSTVLQTAQLRFDNLRKVHDYLVANGMDGQMVGLDYQALDHRGTDKSGTVTVAMGSQDSLLGVTLERDASKVANYVVAQGIGEATNALLVSAIDNPSITALRRREAFLSASQDSDPAQIALRAASTITHLKTADQRITTRFVDSWHTQLYRDFDLGDTIGFKVQPLNFSSTFRCVGITVTDQDGEMEDCALDLNSVRQEYLLKLATGAAQTSDGLGVVTRLQAAVLKYIAASTVSPSNQTFTPASLSDWKVVAGTPAQLTLARPGAFMALYNITVKTAGAVGQIAYARLHVVGQGTANSSLFDKNNTGWTNGMGWSQFSFPPGTYTIQLEVASDNGQTVTVTQGNLDCYLLGG